MVRALPAQTGIYTPALLADVRQAARVVPGELPVAINVVTLNPARVARSAIVEGATADTVEIGYTVFQIRYPSGWVAVDAALDREFNPNSTTFSDAVYANIHEMLRDARLIVVTHEHSDHVAGVVRSPFLAAVQQHTLLTRAQVQTMMTKPNDQKIKIDSATAAKYIVVDYDRFLPVAPGVVLIKAPGHTPGSQMVYVRLASGKEIVLVGDVAWNTVGILEQKPKPVAGAQASGENRDAVTPELKWLKDIMASNVTLVVAHDQAVIDQLSQRGVLHQGFDLKNK
jgi:glyoxylase-like metal-dependent hydrolase (beta-lactamase superfamily II)